MIHSFFRSSSIIAVIFGLLAMSPCFAESLRVVVLGDSLTSGYNLKKEQAYPALLEKLAEADGLDVEVVNAGLSGDTTRGGLRRIKVLARQPIDVLVVALGGNDGLRGLQPAVSQSNLEKIIDHASKVQPDMKILIAGVQMPDNMGEEYTEAFRKIFAAAATKKGVGLLPFILEGVAANDELNFPDGVHPNAKGHAVMAKHVYQTLMPMLRRE